MRKRLRELRASDGGFTLIELLLVIIILGVLAAVVVFSVQGISDRGNNSACKATHSSLLAATEAYYAKHGAYPMHTTDMTTPPDLFLQLGDLKSGFTSGAGNPVGTAPFDDVIKGPNDGWQIDIRYTAATTPPTFTLTNNCT